MREKARQIDGREDGTKGEGKRETGRGARNKGRKTEKLINKENRFMRRHCIQ